MKQIDIISFSAFKYTVAESKSVNQIRLISWETWWPSLYEYMIPEQELSL